MRGVRRAWAEFSSLYWGSRVADEVPALAWFLLSSLAPLALGLTALAALLLGDYEQAQALAEKAARVLPADVHDQIVQLVLRTHDQSPLLIAGSIVAMVWVSSGAVGVIDRVLARLLDSPRQGPLLGKLRNIGLAAAFSLVILLIVLAASAGTGITGRLGATGDKLARLLGPLVALGVGTAFCAGLYRALGGGALPWRAAFTGGLVGGIVLLATPTAAGYYLGVSARRTPVGVFLVLAGILITCYLVALGLLIGAGVSARAHLGAPIEAEGEPGPG